MAAAPTLSLRDWTRLAVLSLIWGGSFFFVEIALRELPVFTIVVARVAIAALILHIVIRAAGYRFPTDRATLLAFLAMGVLNNVIPFSLLVWGQVHIASGLAAILNATTPLFGVLVAHAFTSDEKMTPQRIAGVLIGFLGVVWMLGDALGTGLGANFLGQIACLGAALAYAFAGVFGRRFSARGIPPMVTATGQVTGSSLVMIPMVLLIDQPWTLQMPGAPVIASVIAIAALSTALAYILYFRILATAGATNLLLVTFLVPVSAILLGVLFLGETLAARHITGMALIGLGLAAIDGRLIGRLRPRPRPD